MTALRERGRAPAWPRWTVTTALVLLMLLFLLPLLLLPVRETLPAPALTPVPFVGREEASDAEAAPAPTPVTGWDRGRTLRLLRRDGTVEELTMEDYLWGVVAAEMPASFHLEALKAQAVCARTYCIYQQLTRPDKHPQADVCADSTCCQAWLTRAQAAESWGEEGEANAAKVTRAVGETDGLICLYEGEPIDALFFSSSAGRTADAVEVWGAEVPYLRSVDSPEGAEVPGWQTLVTFTPAEARARILEQWPAARLDDDPQRWFQAVTTTETGAVATLTVGGVAATGLQARSAFGLRSTHFTVEAGERGVTFLVTGYGHGVGLSQYGANYLAQAGRDYGEILAWYYTGVTVSAVPVDR